MSATPARSSMVPPDSGRAIRPGRDCPNCASTLSAADGVKTCGNCGHQERAR